MYLQCYKNRELIQNLSGKEVYYTNYSILLVKNMPCSKIDCQRVFDSIIFSYTICHDLLDQKCKMSRHAPVSRAASERRGNNLQYVKVVCLKAKARI